MLKTLLVCPSITAADILGEEGLYKEPLLLPLFIPCFKASEFFVCLSIVEVEIGLRACGAESATLWRHGTYQSMPFLFL